MGGVQRVPQTLFAHVGAPPVGAGQTLPQAPQLFVSVAVLTSKPFVGLLSQSEYPVAHVPVVHEYTPAVAVHFGVLWLVMHALKQVPQLLVLVMSVSQPFFAMPSQSALVGSAQTPKIVQTALLQVSIAPPAVLHGWTQPPQLFTSVLRLTSHPFDALWSQLSKPVLQVLTEHAYVPPVPLLVHCSVAFVVLHALPHDPQLLVVVIAVSQPSEVLLLQSA